MTKAPNWLAPGFEILQGTDRLDTHALSDAARRYPPGPTIAVDEPCAAAVVEALIAADRENRQVFLTRVPDIPPLPAAPPTAASPDGPAIWLQTSGTTGAPKWVRYRLRSLLRSIPPASDQRRTWLLTYHPLSFAGLQVTLTAAGSGARLAGLDRAPTVPDLAALACTAGADAVSGTPSFWRAFLIALGDTPLDLRLCTLGGEAADQGLLDALRARFPHATLRHVYATTELGRVFTVADGRAGFPDIWLDRPPAGCALRVEDGELWVRSHRAADRHDGWVATGDLVRHEDDRLVFVGRTDDVVNVGGVKVHLAEVEQRLLSGAPIDDARVFARTNPITGYLVMADIVASGGLPAAAILDAALVGLPEAARPRRYSHVTSLPLSPAGKKIRIDR